MKRILASSAVVVAALAVAWALVAVVADDPAPPTVDEMVPAFALPQTADDTLPDAMDLEDLGDVRAETVRKVASDDRAAYWVARSGTADVCLFVHLRGADELVASTCGPATAVYRHGLGLAATGADGAESSVEAYLLPDDVDADRFDREHPALTVLPSDRATVAVVRPSSGQGPGETSGVRRSVQERPGGVALEFIPLGTA